MKAAGKLQESYRRSKGDLKESYRKARKESERIAR